MCMTSWMLKGYSDGGDGGWMGGTKSMCCMTLVPTEGT